MPNFQVLYGPAEEAYERLQQKVTNLSNILDDLNAVLATIDTEMEGRAKGLWQGEQAQWNSKYTEMALNLGVGAATVRKVTDTYNDGDFQTAAIFN